MKKIINTFNSIIGLIFNFLIWSTFTFFGCAIGQAKFSWGLAFGIWLTSLLFNKFFPNYANIGKNHSDNE